MQLLTKFKTILCMGFIATIIKFTVAGFHLAFLKYEYLKLKIKGVLSGHSVAMVAYCVTKMVTLTM